MRTVCLRERRAAARDPKVETKFVSHGEFVRYE
jgi:hypothetical protein